MQKKIIIEHTHSEKKVLEKRAYSRERLHLKNKGDNYEKNQKNLNYNTIKKFPNSLNIYYTNLNTNKYGNYMTKNYQRSQMKKKKYLKM